MSAPRHLLGWTIVLALLASCAAGGDGASGVNLLGAGARCATDDQCDNGLRCDVTAADRVADVTGVCCAGETCCLAPSDCPDSYRSASQCGDGCQGTRRDATCISSVCGSVTVEDDSGCAGRPDDAEKDRPHKDCSPYAPIACTDLMDQRPTCATSCVQKSDCAPGYACDPTHACVPMVGAGDRCAPVEGTTQGTCGDGFKCESGVCCDATAGTCCKSPDDCPSQFRAPSTCSTPTSASDCQGIARIATCNAASVCGTATIEDDSGCAGQTHSCGVYKPIACSSEKVQQPPSCVTSCATNTDCVSGYVCNTSASPHYCAPGASAGQGCTTLSGTTQGTCGSGLKCDGGMCCGASGGACCTPGATCGGNFVCGSNYSCPIACTNDTTSSCASPSTQFCKSNACVTKGLTGASCTSDIQCKSGNCYDDACCVPKTSCGGACVDEMSDGCGGWLECPACTDPDPNPCLLDGEGNILKCDDPPDPCLLAGSPGAGLVAPVCR